MKFKIHSLIIICISIVSIFSFSCGDDIEPLQKIDTCKDANGYIYKTVRIGNQIWMAENLRATKSTNNEDIVAYAPNNDTSLLAVYGRLYDWQSARKACPNGWHLPTKEEWETLCNFLGDNGAAKLKETGTTHWTSPNLSATNIYGFTAVPAGYKATGFHNIRFCAFYWADTQDVNNTAWHYFFCDGANINRQSIDTNYSLSVRCIQDK